MNTSNIRNHKMTNLFHTAALLITMAGLLGLVGWMIAGLGGLKIALAFSVISFLFTPRMPASLIMKAYRARPLHPRAAPQLYKLTAAFAEKADLEKMPTLYYLPNNTLNAFVAGTKDDSAICLTSSLYEALDIREMAGILAHEITHIKNNDMQVMSIASLFNRLTGYGSLIGQIGLLLFLPVIFVSQINIPLLPLLLLVFSPTISQLLILALSRTREYEADLGSAVLTGDPHFLVSALNKLEHVRKNQLQRFFNLGRVNRSVDFLNTHPPTRERIRRLLSLTPDKKTPNLNQRLMPYLTFRSPAG